jgi:hypothetical protein
MGIPADQERHGPAPPVPVTQSDSTTPRSWCRPEPTTDQQLLVTDVSGLPATPLPTARATAGRVTLVVAHGNSLRALCMILDELSPEQVRSLHIPTGVPLRHDLDEALPPRVPAGSYRTHPWRPRGSPRLPLAGS